MNTLLRVKQLLISGTLAATVLGVGVGGAAAAVRDDQKSADIKISVQKSADQSGVLSYSLDLRNDGKGPATSSLIELPFDASALQLVSTEFSKADAWVSKVDGSEIEISIGKIGSGGDTLHATLRFAALQADAALSAPALVHWNDENGGGNASSNWPNRSAAPSGIYALSVSAAGSDYAFSADIFAPNEQVTFWYNTPNGQVVQSEIKDGYVVAAGSTDDEEDEEGASFAGANTDGVVSVRIDTRELSAGRYSLVARGNSGGLVAVGVFDVK
jgi:hypothetical protein